MSTPEEIREQFKRYREGAPPRDDAEKKQYEEWAGLDADDREAALDAQRIDNAFEGYSGPLGWKQFEAEYLRREELAELGITGVALPKPYYEALGPKRAERLERATEDKLAELLRSSRDPGMPRDPEEVKAQARQLGAAGRRLNRDLAARVAEVEERYAAHHDGWTEADRAAGDTEFEAMDAEGPDADRVRMDAAAQRATADRRRENVRAVEGVLDRLAMRPDHPDKWLEDQGGTFTDALAAIHCIRHERELGAPAPEQVTTADISNERTAQPNEPGMDLF
jgi:hypothetical protein